MYKHDIFIILLVIAIVFLFWVSFKLQDIFINAVKYVDAYIKVSPVTGILIFILFSAASVLLGPFTSTPIVPIAVSVWGLYWTFILLLTGWMSGNIIAYFIGRYLGYPLVSLIVSSRKVDQWVKEIVHQMEFGLLFLFRFATPSETGYIFGILRYNFWKYLIITALAELPFAIILIYASQAFLEQKKIIFISMLLVAVLIIGFIAYLFRKRLHQLHQKDIGAQN